MTPKPSTAARRDENEPEIVKAFRSLGASVWHKEGPLDLIVGWPNRTILVEVKDGSKPPSGQKLTRGEAEFIQMWPGECYVMRSVLEATAISRHLKASNTKYWREFRPLLDPMRDEVRHLRTTPIDKLIEEGLVSKR